MNKKIVSTKDERKWQGIPGIEVTPNGKLWVAFYSGGPKEPDKKNYLMLTYSNDNGSTWKEPEIIKDGNWHTRIFDPRLWIDPDERLWLFYNQGSKHANDYTVWGMFTYDIEEDVPNWSEPIKIDIDVPFAFGMNKPIVLKNGDWVKPITWAKRYPKGWLENKKNLQGVVISQNKGVSWKLYGAVKAPRWALENMIIELKDQRLWMLIRTGSGSLWQSFSDDYGRSWSRGKRSQIINPGSRFFISRLKNQNLILINHDSKNERTNLYMAISEDEGLSWKNKIIFDKRQSISYPDAAEDKKGNLHIVYDRDRKGIGEINYVRLDASELKTY